MNYYIKESVKCTCGTTNLFYDTETLLAAFNCKSCGKSIENANQLINLSQFAQKSLPSTVKSKISQNTIWIKTRDAAIIFQQSNEKSSVKSLQGKVRDLIIKQIIIGEKNGREYRVDWPSFYRYLNGQKNLKIKGKTVKEISLLLGISVNKLYKLLQNDTHPKYYGYKGENNRWIVVER